MNTNEPQPHHGDDRQKFCHLFVRKLPEETTRDKLYEEFNRFGKVMHIKLPTHYQQEGDTGPPKLKGYAFVTFENADDAAECLRHGVKIGTTELQIDIARDQTRSPKFISRGRGMPYDPNYRSRDAPMGRGVPPQMYRRPPPPMSSHYAPRYSPYHQPPPPTYVEHGAYHEPPYIRSRGPPHMSRGSYHHPSDGGHYNGYSPRAYDNRYERNYYQPNMRPYRGGYQRGGYNPRYQQQYPHDDRRREYSGRGYSPSSPNYQHSQRKSPQRDGGASPQRDMRPRDHQVDSDAYRSENSAQSQQSRQPPQQQSNAPVTQEEGDWNL